VAVHEEEEPEPAAAAVKAALPEAQPPLPKDEPPHVRYLRNADRAHRMLLEAGAGRDGRAAGGLADGLVENLISLEELLVQTPMDLFEEIRDCQLALGEETDPAERRLLERSITELTRLMPVAENLERLELRDEVTEKIEDVTDSVFQYSGALQELEHEDASPEDVSKRRAAYVKAYNEFRECVRQALE
jgi:hypothetical protein